jgi:hypothetical protein
VLEPAFVSWPDLMVFDRTLGWRPRPDLDARYLADRDDVFRIVTDGEGWPGRRPLYESDVVVVGDSFAFGYGVDTPRSFAELDPRLRVKAIGAPGYSMVQGVRLLEQFGPRLKGKLIVWFLYPENDLQDNLAPEMRQYRAPFARLDQVRGEWEIVDEHLQPLKWECSNLDTTRLFPRFCVSGPFSTRAFSACDYLIGRAERACREAGADLAVVTIPHPMQLTKRGRARLAWQSGNAALCDADLSDRRIADSCGRYGIALVSGAQHLTARDYKWREGIHWNERGHRKMASLLARIYDSFQARLLHDSVAEPVSEVVARPAPIGAAIKSPPAEGLGVGR